MTIFEQLLERYNAGDQSVFEQIRYSLNHVLKEREIIIIREVYGIDCYKKEYEEIGDELGLTVTRVDQIRAKALAKLEEYYRSSSRNSLTIEAPKRAGKKIRVTFPDGTIIEKSKACDTLIEVIKMIGVKKVASLGIPGIERKGILLLDTKLADDEGYRKSQKDMGDGYYLLTKTSTDKKIIDLITISSRLNLHLNVEVSNLDCNHIYTKPGDIYEKNGIWFFLPNGEIEDFSPICYTDHWTADTVIIRHQSRYGIFGLPNLGDYGNDGSLMWECLTNEPFPYEEVFVIGLESNDYGFVAYKKDKKWGINYMYYSFIEDRVKMSPVVSCDYKSLAEAQKHLLTWRNPFSKEELIIDVRAPKVITEDTLLINLPGIEKFKKRRPGAINQFLLNSIKEFRAIYEKRALKGKGRGYYDDLIQYIDSLF